LKSILTKVRAELNKITTERNPCILKMQRIARNRAEIEKEMDALKPEADNCRCQCKEVAFVEKKCCKSYIREDVERMQIASDTRGSEH
jgi:hypothetical protein